MSYACPNKQHIVPISLRSKYFKETLSMLHCHASH